jgi:L-threonylcarbamoyladenylate synthase
MLPRFDTEIGSGQEALKKAADLLAAGELVGIPTETVYGLAADALNPSACARIFEAKQRPLTDPLIVHLPDSAWLHRLSTPSSLAMKLAKAFWPGPLTLVVPKSTEVPDLVTAGQSTVAVRVSAHPILHELLQIFGKPVAAPSANRFGRISPTTSAHVMEELGGRIPWIVEGGSCAHGIESTIVFVEGGTIEILRQGPITRSMLERFGPVTEAKGGITAPGSLKSHYAPQTPMRLVSFEELASQATPRHGALTWKDELPGFGQLERLTPSGDPVEAAANLYAAMRRLDAAGLDLIFAEAPPHEGLGEAIAERLRKASAERD